MKHSLLLTAVILSCTPFLRAADEDPSAINDAIVDALLPNDAVLKTDTTYLANDVGQKFAAKLGLNNLHGDEEAEELPGDDPVQVIVGPVSSSPSSKDDPEKPATAPLQASAPPLLLPTPTAPSPPPGVLHPETAAPRPGLDHEVLRLISIELKKSIPQFVGNTPNNILRDHIMRQDPLVVQHCSGFVAYVSPRHCFNELAYRARHGDPDARFCIYLLYKNGVCADSHAYVEPDGTSFSLRVHKGRAQRYLESAAYRRHEEAHRILTAQRREQERSHGPAMIRPDVTAIKAEFAGYSVDELDAIVSQRDLPRYIHSIAQEIMKTRARPLPTAHRSRSRSPRCSPAPDSRPRAVVSPARSRSRSPVPAQRARSRSVDHHADARSQLHREQQERTKIIARKRSQNLTKDVLTVHLYQIVTKDISRDGITQQAALSELARRSSGCPTPKERGAAQYYLFRIFDKGVVGFREPDSTQATQYLNRAGVNGHIKAQQELDRRQGESKRAPQGRVVSPARVASPPRQQAWGPPEASPFPPEIEDVLRGSMSDSWLRRTASDYQRAKVVKYCNTYARTKAKTKKEAAHYYSFALAASKGESGEAINGLNMLWRGTLEDDRSACSKCLLSTTCCACGGILYCCLGSPHAGRQLLLRASDDTERRDDRWNDYIFEKGELCCCECGPDTTCMALFCCGVCVDTCKADDVENCCGKCVFGCFECCGGASSCWTRMWCCGC